ncbi:MAG: hypothetical protein CMM01_24060 [Rhodopirellula sp.]|nr:hypothetical protein [Rhodopirellula sp.]
MAKQEGPHIVEAVLHCTNAACKREYPVIDGVPLIISDIRRYLSENAFQIALRDDLSEVMESILGDCIGPGAIFDIVRQHLSSYAWDHYGDLDPMEDPIDPEPGAMTRVLHTALDSIADDPEGPLIDLGCSVGRSSFDLADRCGQMVLGVDLNFPMLRMASQLLRTGIVRYPRRRVGVVYDRREFSAEMPSAKMVDFWACDALALPFADGSFAGAVSMNMLDCVASPVDFLVALARSLCERAFAIVACPYDWSNAATPMEHWLGGHSQRGPDDGASDSVLRHLLDPSSVHAIDGLHLLHEMEVDWQVRVHARSTMSYKSHLVIAGT